MAASSSDGDATRSPRRMTGWIKGAPPLLGGALGRAESGGDRKAEAPRGRPLEFEVVVREVKGESRHQVTMAQETCDRLTAGKHTPEHCV